MMGGRLGVIAWFLTLSLAGAAPAAPQDPLAADLQILKDAGIAADGPALLDYFRKRALKEAEQERIQTLIRQLGDANFKARVKASAELVALGMPARPFLREAVKSRDLEVARRAEECLRQLAQNNWRVGVTEAAARVLAARKPPEAAKALLTYLPFAEDEAVSEEVENALTSLALKDGRPEPVLLEALSDPSTVRRAAAMEALCRAGHASRSPAMLKLLHDPDLGVRLRAALALAAHDKQAVSVLIELIVLLPAETAWQAEDPLLRLAEERAPGLPAGREVPARLARRDAWKAWWHDHGDKADLTRLEGAGRRLGYTLLVFLNAGQVIELDSKDKPRLQISGLNFPLDAQVVGDDHVLVTEHYADRVTERDRAGQVVWEYSAEKPLMAQRLANGNTFIATQSRLLEVDRQGRETMSYMRAGDMFMKAQRLPYGEIAFVTTSRRFVRVDATGKELQNLPANVATSGGRIEAFPDGRFLVPEKTSNRVAEYDMQGRVVWQAVFPEPVAAVRLVNGHTLVTSFNQTRAVELDRSGREVWEFSANTRLTRAFRR
jgi:hypothetical protein